MMDKTIKGKMLVCGILAFGLLAAPGFLSPQAECLKFTNTFVENFDTTNFKNIPLSSVAEWPSGPITLSRLGANFDILQPSGMGARIYVCAPGDFDGDGKPDLIGLDIANNNRLILIRNQYEDLDDDKIDDDGIIYMIDPAEVYDEALTCGPASITAGDFNNDGLIDFFFMKNGNDSFSYSSFVAAMYINQGTATDPDFRPYYESPTLDFTSRFMSAGIYINWAADHVHAVDIDKDGDMDVLAISQDKIFLVRNPGASNFQLNNFEIIELPYDQRTGFVDGRGGSTINAGDFDGDGDVDIVGGTVNNYLYLVYYENDGTGNFTRKELTIPEPTCAGSVGTCVEDFNKDGRLDIFVATDRWNAGYEARMWMMFNKGIDAGEDVIWQFKCLNLCEPILPDPHDTDMAVACDYDGDGDMDVIVADANHSGDYFLIRNNLAPVFALHGEAVSTNIAGELDPNRFAITEVKITQILQGVLGGDSTGLKVEIYVSANGQNWELYRTFEGAAIANASDLPVHKFLHFGTQLLWKAVLSASQDDMVEYENASYESPYIGEIDFEYSYVERREYARTSVAASIYTSATDRTKLIIAGTFYFPGWQGQLRAYDLTRMTSLSSEVSELRTITRPDLGSSTGREIVAENVEIYWDAGQMLADRSAGSRVIYTATKAGGVFTRQDFTTSNVAILGPILQDVNNDNSGLIEFIRGEGRDWKLGDINHSTPVSVGPPDGSESSMGAGYDDFKEAWKDRPITLYVGANDGMLHCFDVKTGEERWAFIPYNLLPKLRNMWAVDAATRERYYAHDVYVDGSPVVSDAYIDTNGDGAKEWATILVCGQGPGKGSAIGGGTNYYFALDITDPENPRPLWEFTDATMGETWSTPVIGKVTKNGVHTWAAFMGSGYKNTAAVSAGNTFYAITLQDGVKFWSFTAADIDTRNRWASRVNIPNAIPGAPESLDYNNDGLVDRVYVGDLDGRMWKIDTTPDWVRANSWGNVALYTDDDYYPIVVKPAVWMNTVIELGAPRVFFGTGGDDRAPTDVTYGFLCVLDNADKTVEWYIGDPAAIDLEENACVGDFGAGEKVWADPKIANYTVFFSTLTGNIESVDPCLSLLGEGKLYARFVETVGGGGVGTSAIKGTTGPLDYLNLAIKSRSAVTLGEWERTSGLRKREVYIHEFDSTIQKLEQPVGSILRIKSWREVYKVIR